MLTEVAAFRHLLSVLFIVAGVIIMYVWVMPTEVAAFRSFLTYVLFIVVGVGIGTSCSQLEPSVQSLSRALPLGSWAVQVAGFRTLEHSFNFTVFDLSSPLNYNWIPRGIVTVWKCLRERTHGVGWEGGEKNSDLSVDAMWRIRAETFRGQRKRNSTNDPRAL